MSANRFRQDLGDMSRRLDVLRRLLATDQTGPSPAPDHAVAGTEHD